MARKSDLWSNRGRYSEIWQDPSGGGAEYDVFVTVGTSEADYITDGTNDRVKIQLALDSINTAGGGTLFLKPGTYTLDNTLDVYSNTILRGAGVGATIIKQADGANKFRVIRNDGFAAGGNSDIVLRDFTFNGNKANQSSTSIGLNFQTGSRITLENLYVYDTRDEGIFLTGITNGIVKNCVVVDPGRDAIVMSTGTTGIVEGCKVSGSTARSGILISNAANVRVLGNQSDSNALHGIDMSGASATKNVVNANSCSENVRYGIYCGLGPTDVVISDNYTYSNAFGGIGTEDNNNILIAANYSEADSYGIYLDTCNYITVTGNYVYFADKSGIELLSASYNNLTGNYLKDNSQLTNATYRDISLTDDGVTYSTKNVVVGNTCLATAANKTAIGIAEQAVSDDYNVITNNFIEGQTSTGLQMKGVNSDFGHNVIV